MQQWLTGLDLANWLGMTRLTDARTFIIVEGPTDAQALDPHIDTESAVTFPAHGKDKAEQALHECEARGTSRTLAVLDLDWTALLTAPNPSSNAAYTDDYDLDATILLLEPVLTRVVTAHSEKAARDRYLANVGRSLVDVVISLAGPVGAMRLANERDNYGVSCDRFPVHAVMDRGRTVIDVARMTTVAVRRSENACVVEATLEAEVLSICHDASSLRRMCNGHDVCAVVAALIKHLGGPLLSGEGVAAIARAAFSWTDLCATQLYRSVADWATNNHTSVWAVAAVD